MCQVWLNQISVKPIWRDRIVKYINLISSNILCVVIIDCYQYCHCHLYTSNTLLKLWNRTNYNWIKQQVNNKRIFFLPPCLQQRWTCKGPTLRHTEILQHTKLNYTWHVISIYLGNSGLSELKTNSYCPTVWLRPLQTSWHKGIEVRCFVLFHLALSGDCCTMSHCVWRCQAT